MFHPKILGITLLEAIALAANAIAEQLAFAQNLGQCRYLFLADDVPVTSLPSPDRLSLAHLSGRGELFAG
jgi:hypothetical protein